MGQKVNPLAIRLGIIRRPFSRWYADSKSFSQYLLTDRKIRKFLMNRLKGAAISHIDIERLAKSAKIVIHSARPGVIIGKKGNDIEELRKEINRIIQLPVHIAVEEVKKPELNAKLVAESIAQQLERRVMFRRVIKRSLQNTMRAGAEGVKVMLGGRLAGAEIARTEWAREGRVPLHTFRADIDYATARANTTYGVIGVKVWIYKGEIFNSEKK
jgi:small subunit ribosomal protein S3